MEERGVHVDHSTIQRWVINFVPLLEAEISGRKKAFDSAASPLNGIEMVRMIKKGQISYEDNSVRNSAEIFYSLAA